jgi:hypothetical protein
MFHRGATVHRCSMDSHATFFLFLSYMLYVSLLLYYWCVVCISLFRCRLRELGLLPLYDGRGLHGTGSWWFREEEIEAQFPPTVPGGGPDRHPCRTSCTYLAFPLLGSCWGSWHPRDVACGAWGLFLLMSWYLQTMIRYNTKLTVKNWVLYSKVHILQLCHKLILFLCLILTIVENCITGWRNTWRHTFYGCVGGYLTSISYANM